LKRPCGIKGSLFRKAQLTALLSETGRCELCGEPGRTRYFLACKLDKIRFLCDGHYLQIREKLEKTLKKTLGEFH